MGSQGHGEKRIGCRRSQEAGLAPREFPIGSEWLYLKIYCGVKSAHAILVGQLYPAIHQMLKDGIIKKFFFVNFSDLEFHLLRRMPPHPFIHRKPPGTHDVKQDDQEQRHHRDPKLGIQIGKPLTDIDEKHRHQQDRDLHQA